LYRLEEKYANGTLDMDLALKAFRRLKEEFQQEFTEFELQVLSATVADQQCCGSGILSILTPKNSF
jgi:hypothetical protein